MWSPVTLPTAGPDLSTNRNSLPAWNLGAVNELYSPAVLIQIALAVIGVATLLVLKRTLNHNAIQAEAAKASADTLIKAERAWISADLKLQDAPFCIGGNNEALTGFVSLTCTNYGKTPGWITEKRIGLIIVKSIPLAPLLDRAQIAQVSPEPLAPTQQSVLTYEAMGNGNPHEMKNCIIIYGAIFYTDIFREHRETRFAYMVNPGLDSMQRMIGRPEWNTAT